MLYGFLLIIFVILKNRKSDEIKYAPLVMHGPTSRNSKKVVKPSNALGSNMDCKAGKYFTI